MLKTCRIIVALVPAAVLLVFGPNVLSQLQPNGQPCVGDCDGQLPACQNAWQPYISAVFLGLATDIHEDTVPITLDGEKKHTEKLEVTFVVREAFVGLSDQVVTVTSGGDMCAFPFLKGHQFLVYAQRLSNGQLYVSTCYGTKFAELAADDLTYLRGLPNTPHGATFFGNAFRFAEPEKGEFQVRRNIPEAGHKIKIIGASQSYEALVDARGNFTMGGLPPGRYTVSLDSTGEVYTSPPVRSATVDVADKGCARFNFRIDPYALATAKARCPLPPDFGVIRVDREHKRLFLEGTKSSVVSESKIASYLNKLGRVIEVCEPSWKSTWSVSFFANPKLAGYKTDDALLEAVESGDWGEAYVAEYDRVTQLFTVFPSDSKKRRTTHIILSR